MSTLIGEFASTTLADHAFLTESDLDIQYPSPDSSLVKDDTTTPPPFPTTPEAVTTPPDRSPSSSPPSFSVLLPIQLTPVINPEDVSLPDGPDVELDDVVEISSDNADGEPTLLFDILDASVVHDPVHAVTSPSPSPSVYDPTEPLVGQVFVDDLSSLSSSLAMELVSNPSDSGDSDLELVLQAETPGSPIAQEAIPAVSPSSANEARLTALDDLKPPEDSPISPQPLPDPEKKAKRSRPHTRNKDRQTRIKNASVPGSEEWHANEDSRRLQRQRSPVGVSAPLAGLPDRPSVTPAGPASNPSPSALKRKALSGTPASFDLLMQRVKAQQSAIHALVIESRMESPGAGPSNIGRALPTFGSLGSQQRVIASSPFVGRIDDVRIYLCFGRFKC